MNTLSKADIAQALTAELGLNKLDSKLVLEEFLEALRLALENGQHIKLSGFGNFILRDKSQRPGRNPKTGEVIPVVERRVVTFKPGLKLKTKIEKDRHQMNSNHDR